MTRWALAAVLTCAACGGAADAERRGDQAYGLGQYAEALRQYRLPEQETMPLLAHLLALPLPEDRYPPLTFSPQRQRQKTFEVLLAMLLEPSARRPVLFILEDVHWTDPSTLELLDLLMDQIPTVSCCALLTCRPTFQPPWSSR